jgi:hypothetical protein
MQMEPGRRQGDAGAPQTVEKKMNEIEKQQKIESMLKGIAKAITCVVEDTLGQMGFALLVFEFYEPGICHYISNAQRADMIEALRELADRLEQSETIPPGHGMVQ